MYHIVAVDLYGETLCRKTIATPYSNTEEYYRQVAENTEAFLHSFPDSEDRVLALPSPHRELFPLTDRLSPTARS